MDERSWMRLERVKMNKFKIGYTQGVYDMFHIGHLNLINHAKEQCDYLIVGVNTDALVWEYKHKHPVVNEQNRMEIVRNIKAVDQCLLVNTLDKTVIWQELHFDCIFIGDDWKGNARWEETEKALAEYGADVMYLPYTQGVSSTFLRKEKVLRVEE